MNCADMVNQIALRIEGTLPAEDEAPFERHLAGCARCRAELRLQRAIADNLAAPDGPPPSETFTARVVEAAFRPVPARRPLRRLPQLAAAVAMGAALLWAYRLGADFRPPFPTEEVSLLEPLLRPYGELAGSLSGLLGGLLPASDGYPALALLAGLPAVWGLHRVLSFLSE